MKYLFKIKIVLYLRPRNSVQYDTTENKQKRALINIGRSKTHAVCQQQ